jgi:hypothetical protein
VRLAGRERAAHRGTDVVVLDLERGEPFQLLGAAKMRLRGLGELGEVREMRMARQIRFPASASRCSAYSLIVPSIR